MSKKKDVEVNLDHLEPELQKLFRERSDLKEWQSFLDNGAIRIMPPSQAEHIRPTQPDRIMACRCVRTWKVCDEHPTGLSTPLDPSSDIIWKAKSRLAALGHHDPDLFEKVAQQALSSPVVDHAAVRTGLQAIATCKWKVQIGDISTAYLNSDEKQKDANNVFCNMPPGGVNNVHPHSLLEVLKTFYGYNDAPDAWRRVLDR